MVYRLIAADIRIEIHSTFDIIVGEESLPFLCSFQNPDCILKYSRTDEIDFSEMKNGFLHGNRVFCRKGEEETVFVIPFPKSDPFGIVKTEKNQPYTLICEYTEGSESFIDYLKNIYTVFSIETIFLRFNALILHSSFIRWKDAGILFSAPSGTGKSTQASLWEKYENAEVVNGDRAGIRYVNGNWRVYGLPLAGSSGIYKNVDVPLKCIVLLEQFEENKIQEAPASEVYKFLYPEIMMHRWDRIYEEKASELVLKLIRDIPVYKLKCRPDQEAVNLLKSKLRGIL